MRKMLFITLLMGGLCTTVSVAKAQERLPEYLQAEKYTQEKLNTMLFSTVVDRSDGYCKHCSYVLSKKSILKTPRTYFGQGIHALQTAMQNPDAHRHIPLPLQQ